MVFHMSTDAIGLVVGPMFSEWWKKPALFWQPPGNCHHLERTLRPSRPHLKDRLGHLGPGEIACCPRYSDGTVARVLSKSPRFDAPSNYIKSNRLRGAPVPNVSFSVPFRRNPRCNRLFDGEPVFAQAGRRSPGKPAQISARIASARNPTSFGRRGEGPGKICLPDAHQRKGRPFPPQERHSTRNLPKHSNPRMI